MIGERTPEGTVDQSPVLGNEKGTDAAKVTLLDASVCEPVIDAPVTLQYPAGSGGSEIQRPSTTFDKAEQAAEPPGSDR